MEIEDGAAWASIPARMSFNRLLMFLLYLSEVSLETSI